MKAGKRFIKRLRAFIAKPLVVVQTKPVIINQSELCPNPIFLVGVHRSGTSLVRRMSNSHPNIACPPESFFLSKYCELYKDEMSYPGFRGFGLTQQDMQKHIARQASELHEAFRLAHGKRRWADKTPQYTACLNELRELFGPAARFVLIFRDPRDIAYSIYERKWRFTESSDSEDFGDLLEEPLDYVSDRVGMLRDFHARYPEQSIELWYENVVQAPRSELKRILIFLGEEFSDAMMKFNDGAHNFGTEDPMVRGTSKLTLSRGYWRNMPENERLKLDNLLGPLAVDLGYDR